MKKSEIYIIISLIFTFLCGSVAYSDNSKNPSQILERFDNLGTEESSLPRISPKPHGAYESSKFDFKIEIGIESLKYKEYMSDSVGIPGIPLESDAKVTNTVLDIQFEYNFYNKSFLGTKGIIPINKGDDTEEWMLFDILYQTNTLEYSWTRWDIYSGYTFKDAFLMDTVKPYLGVRASWGKQIRNNLVVSGAPTDITATEKIDSFGVLLGVRGENEFLEGKFTLVSHFEYVLPFNVNVTNSFISGWSTDSDSGYTCEFNVGGNYKFTEAWSLGINTYFGKMRWSGSDWISYPGGSARWPANDTEYFGATLSMICKF
jgi:hypothetical protein